MPAPRFKPGDEVQHKSNTAQKMVVARIVDDQQPSTTYECAWFRNNQRHSDFFAEAELEPWQPGKLDSGLEELSGKLG